MVSHKSLCISVIFYIISVMVIGCEESSVNDRTNPYDPGNPLAKKVSIIPLTCDGRSNYPSWSPDETKVVYRGPYGLCVMNIADRSITKLKMDRTWESNPKWSPKGDKIAYLHTAGDNDMLMDISVRDYPENNNPHTLVTDGEICREGSLVWSPQDPDDPNVTQQIAYISADTNKIKITDADGTNKNKRELNPSGLVSPVSLLTGWSLDGNYLIAICGDRPQAFKVDIKNNSAQPLPVVKSENIKLAKLCFDAVWSADNSKILYTTLNYGRYELWTMNPDGEQKVNILAVDEENLDELSNERYAIYMRSLNWSKDGSSIIFVGSDKFSDNNDRRHICLLKMQTE